MSRKFSENELLIASHNAGKIAEFQKILGDQMTIKSASDFNLEDVEETGTTFSENARLKAEYAAKATGLPALADDSGFCIDALDGRPGLYSARVTKKYGGYPQTFEAFHQELGDKPRTARFVCVLALAWPDGHVEEVSGEVEGSFIYPARGLGGFGYDPVFIRKGESKSFGEMSPQEKHQNSHRGNAIQAMLEKCFS